MAQRPPSNGPGGPVSAASGLDAVGKTGATSGVKPTEAAAPIASTTGVAATSATAAPQAAQAVHPVAAALRAVGADQVQSIADRLRRGVLSPSQAVEELIEDAVQRNLPGLGPDSALTQELRALLVAYAKDDPYLTSRISRLGIHR